MLVATRMTRKKLHVVQDLLQERGEMKVWYLHPCHQIMGEQILNGILDVTLPNATLPEHHPLHI
jgi:hypothetical protein